MYVCMYVCLYLCMSDGMHVCMQTSLCKRYTLQHVRSGPLGHRGVVTHRGSAVCPVHSAFEVPEGRQRRPGAKAMKLTPTICCHIGGRLWSRDAPKSEMCVSILMLAF